MLKSNIDVFFVTSFLCSLKFLLFHRIEYPRRCLWKKNSEMYRHCDLDLWPMKVNIFLWIEYNPISILYKFQINISSNSREIKYQTRQSEMADLARRATRWVGTFPYILTPIPNLYDHSFPRYGQITFLTFRRPTTLTFDLTFWKYLSVTVYPYVICMPSFIMIGWEMAEILHIEILRKHGQTHTQTDRQTDRHGHYNTSPSPYGGRGKYCNVT